MASETVEGSIETCRTEIVMHTLILLLQYGNTPVKLAAEKGNIGTVRLLMEKGAVVTIADKVSNNM